MEEGRQQADCFAFRFCGGKYPGVPHFYVCVFRVLIGDAALGVSALRADMADTGADLYHMSDLADPAAQDTVRSAIVGGLRYM